MAVTPLAITTTLVIFKAQVREKTVMQNEQSSGLYNLPLVDIIHEAVIKASKLAKVELYKTDLTVTQGTALDDGTVPINISTYDIQDIDSITLVDMTYGNIPIIKDNEEFNIYAGKYSGARMANKLLATIRTVTTGGNTYLALCVLRGANKPMAQTPQKIILGYQRVPTKATSDSTKIDLPENLIPIAVEEACKIVLTQGKIPQGINNIEQAMIEKVEENG